MEFLDFIDKIHVIQVNNEMYLNLKIYDLFNIGYQYLDLLTNEILKQNIYTNVKKLYLRSVNTAFNLNHLKQIQVLDISQTDFISDKDIEELNPIELNISFNPNVTNLNHMSSLKKLMICGSKISYDGINKLKLKVVDITDSYLTSSLFSEQSDIEIIDEYFYGDDDDIYSDISSDDDNDYNNDDYDDDDDMDDRYYSYCDGLSSLEKNTGDYCSYEEFCSTRY